MPKYTDLLITNNDFTLDAGGNPALVHDVDCIAQDIEHMIRETGLLVELIANRDARKKAANLNKIIMAVEEDERIKPGTVYIEEPSLGTFYLVAETLEFGELQRTL
ncbi:DUF2590 family protein (plasmid) [Halodesulfovibrio aestuarii]|uniref:DUF2590 family protein n=1 Tax=Halodesulfovibrio aestuarii TaxID=126333 RepID=A0A8G2FJ85_9BACT|nr:DUF2590 family protein [Halodesulfovibrio aestuarii]SHJ72278.1 Protein of unknown function [Halodesulfovibrio aestuarii]